MLLDGERVTKLSILFVAGNKNSAKFMSDPAFIYRCQNPALALAEQGHNVSCIHYRDLSRQKNPVDLIIFHRPCFRDWHARWLLSAELKRRRRQGTVLIADFDDLVFAPDYAQFSPGVVNGYVTLRQTQKNFAQHAKTLQYFDELTVSTQPLLDFASNNVGNDSVTWIPNSPHLLWRDKQPTATHSATFDVCYLPGTRSHDKDFALIAEPLADFLAEHPDARLKITGVLDNERFPDSLKRLATQVVSQPKRPYSDYWQVVNDGHVHLAPLEDSIFNRCKSALKAIEANYFHRPLIASPIPDMKRFAGPGVDLADDANDWYERLKRHYHQRSLNDKLREQVLAQYSVQQHAAELIARYEQIRS